MLAPGHVGFRQEGPSVVYPGELRGLAYLSLVDFLGPVQDGLPNVLREGFVCVRSVR